MPECSKCKRNLGDEDFDKDARTPSGLRYECKRCRGEAVKGKAADYYSKNKELVKKRAREKYWRNKVK